MKLSIILLAVSFAQVFATTTYSQKAKVTLDLKNTMIKDVLANIESQSEFFFLYSPKMINDKKKVDIKVSNKRIDFVLKQLFADSNSDYIVLDRQIVISDKTQIAPFTQSIIKQIEISGSVKDIEGNPIPGVNVRVKNTNEGTITNFEGEYTIQVADENAILVFSFIGYRTQEITVGLQTVIDIVMEEGISRIEEVVVIGYGTIKKNELTSAVSGVKSEDFIEGAVADVAQLIKGKVPGLSIIRTNDDPTGGSQIILRGAITLSAGTQPLVVIDGVPGALSDVAPNDIESVDVLKDGSAAAIYGTRGSNGVILITTKKAREMKTTVEINSYVSTQVISKKIDFMDAAQYREYVAQGKPGAIDYGGNTNWLDEIMQTPISNVHNINIKGGNSKTNYIANINYAILDGIMKKSDNTVLTTRFEVNHSILDGKLRFNANVMGREQKYFAGGDGYSYRGDVYRNALIYNPTDPIKDENGVWTEHVAMNNYNNPVALIEEVDGENKSNNYKIFGSISYNPIDDLTIKLLGSHNSWNSIRGYSETKNHYSNVAFSKNGFASRGSFKSRDNLLDFTVNYLKSIYDHNIELLGGYSWQEKNNEGFWANNFDFPSEYSYNNLSSGTALTRGEAGMDSWQAESKLIGYFARFSYNYKGKYMLMASIRREGSSKFGKNNKWANFPAISAGWNIKNEAFLGDFTFISALKVRAGFGITGTQPTDSYISLSRLGSGSSYYNNGEWTPVIAPLSNSNPNLKWEKKEEINIGLDFALLSSRIGGTVDVYQRTTKDMLWNYNVPNPPYLFSTVLANAGTMENKGIEAQVYFYPVLKKDFTWRSTFNVSSNKNTLVSLSNDEFVNASGYFYSGHTGEPIQQNTHKIEEGGAIGNFWGFRSIDIDEDGYWIIEGEDGEPKSIFDQQPDDKQVIGNGIPKMFASWDNIVHYKDFDLAVTMRGAFGYDILNFTDMFYGVPVSLTRGNVLSNTFDDKYGKGPLNDQQDLQYVSYFVEKGDFWKIDNITLGYTYEPANSFIKSFRVYASAGNLFTFTSYSGLDPEVNALGLSPGNDYRDRYPTTRNYTLGVSLKF